MTCNHDFIETREFSNVCRNCGHVAGSSALISNEAEWRIFDASDNDLIRCEAGGSWCGTTLDLKKNKQSVFFKNLHFYLDAYNGFFLVHKKHLLYLHEKILKKISESSRIKKINFNRKEYVVSLVIYYWSLISKISFPISFFRGVFDKFNKRHVFNILKQLKTIPINYNVNQVQNPLYFFLNLKIDEFLNEEQFVPEQQYYDNFKLLKASASQYLDVLQTDVFINNTRRTDTQINVAIFLAVVEHDLLKNIHKSKLFKNKINTIIGILKKHKIFMPQKVFEYMTTKNRQCQNN